MPREVLNKPDRNQTSEVISNPDEGRSGKWKELFGIRQDNKHSSSSLTAPSRRGKIYIDMTSVVQVMAFYNKVQ